MTRGDPTQLYPAVPSCTQMYPAVPNCTQLYPASPLTRHFCSVADRAVNEISRKFLQYSENDRKFLQYSENDPARAFYLLIRPIILNKLKNTLIHSCTTWQSYKLFHAYYANQTFKQSSPESGMLLHKQQKYSLTGGFGPSVINFAYKHPSFKWNHLNRIDILNPDLNPLLPP